MRRDADRDLVPKRVVGPSIAEEAANSRPPDDDLPPAGGALAVPLDDAERPNSRMEEINRLLARCGAGTWPQIDYTDHEHEQWREHTWRLWREREVFGVGTRLGWRVFADLLTTGVPQAEEISDRLREVSGWRLEPVAGLLPPEEFFRLLAVQRFPCSLWLREPTMAAFSPAPDAIHEIFGHVTQLADPRIGDLYSMIGAKYLAADPCRRGPLSRGWWFIGEVGVLEGSERTAIGGAILSSPMELRKLRSARLRAFDFEEMTQTNYDPLASEPVGTYFAATSLDEILAAVRCF